MIGVEATDAADALQRALVTHLATQRITGVGRIDDDAAVLDDLYRLTDQTGLGVFRMYVKMLTHSLFSQWGQQYLPARMVTGQRPMTLP